MTAKQPEHEGGAPCSGSASGTSHQRSEVLYTRYEMDGGNGFYRCPDGARRGGDGTKWLLRSAKAGGKTKAVPIGTANLSANISAKNINNAITCNNKHLAVMHYLTRQVVRRNLLQSAGITFVNLVYIIGIYIGIII